MQGQFPCLSAFGASLAHQEVQRPASADLSRDAGSVRLGRCNAYPSRDKRPYVQRAGGVACTCRTIRGDVSGFQPHEPSARWVLRTDTISPVPLFATRWRHNADVENAQFQPDVPTRAGRSPPHEPAGAHCIGESADRADAPAPTTASATCGS